MHFDINICELKLSLFNETQRKNNSINTENTGALSKVIDIQKLIKGFHYIYLSKINFEITEYVIFFL